MTEPVDQPVGPYADQETPDLRSPGRYLWWLVTRQWRRVAAGALLGSSWMICLTLPPYLLSRAIDGGLQPGGRSALVGWVAALVGVGVLNAWLAIMRHRTMTRVRLDGAFRTVRVVVAQATRLGAALPRRATAGEIVTIGSGDVAMIADTLTVTGPGVGAVLSYVVVAALLLTVSPLLAAVVLLGVPLLAVLVGPLLGRLQGAESVYRDRQGSLAARFADIAGGLRVLNGIGGKDVYAERYRRGSQELQAEGYRVGAVTSWIQALGVGLPTLFLGAVTWLAARMAAQGDITVGELVAVYGYTAVLVVPVSFFVEGGYDISRGLVAARRVIHFLSLEPDSTGRKACSTPLNGPGSPSVLHDPESGVEVVPGTLTALVCARPSDSATVIDRLGGFVASAATWGTARLDEIEPPRSARGFSSRTTRPTCSPARCVMSSPAAGTGTTRRSAVPSTPPRPRTSSAACRTGSAPPSTPRAAISPAASGSVSASSGPCWPIPRSSWRSSRPRPSMRTPRQPWRPGCARHGPAGPRSSPAPPLSSWTGPTPCTTWSTAPSRPSAPIATCWTNTPVIASWCRVVRTMTTPSPWTTGPALLPGRPPHD